MVEQIQLTQNRFNKCTRTFKHNRSLNNDTVGLVGYDSVTFNVQTINVTLNSPADDQCLYKSVTLGASAEVTGGAYLVNATLMIIYWKLGARNTTNLPNKWRWFKTYYYYYIHKHLLRWRCHRLEYEILDSDGDCGFATSNYTFSIDATPPI